MLLQMEQRWRLALTSRMASASSTASSSVERRMWNARRCALLLPMPGNFFSSSMRRTMGPANFDILDGHSHTAKHAAHAGLNCLVHLAGGFIHCGHDQVLQHLNVCGSFLLDLDFQ